MSAILSKKLWLSLLALTGAFLPALSRATDPGPVVATVGEFSVAKAQVARLAQMAQSLRRVAGLESDAVAPPADERALAIETLLVASKAPKDLDGIDSEGLDEYKSLLARLVLDRLVQSAGDSPVSESEVLNTHQAEIEQYQTTGTSELFSPTRIDAAVIVIGLFPDGHSPQPDEVLPVSRKEALALAREFRTTLGDRVFDLDRFLSLARGFCAGHPTVKIESLSGIALERILASVDLRLHTALVALDGNGAISQPIEFEGGVYLIRRGYTSPGKGERPEQIRPQLEDKVRALRRQEVFRRLMASLVERYRVQTWPERLRTIRDDLPQP